MEKIISISFGEIFLKGKNRGHFIDLARTNIKEALTGIQVQDMYSDHGKYYIEAEESHFDELIARLQTVFGIAHINPTIRCEKDLEAIKEALSAYIEEYGQEARTFKIISKRADKSFSPKSPELNNIFGGHVLKNFENLKVDVHDPDLALHVDIRHKHAYIYGRQYEAAKGLPVASSGKGLSLLSGGIDSPVASYMMAKRGVEVDMVHFNSYPFTSDRSFEKVKGLAETLTKYTGKQTLYNINILPIQRVLSDKCQERNMTILTRRFMMRIGQALADQRAYQMLITGESLGQVASQTIEGITATDSVTQVPVLRPLIGLDKEEIVAIAENIGTYETSILPYEDCCTVFQPDKPNIRPSLQELEEEEEKLDIRALIDGVLGDMEVHEIQVSYD